jgi:prenylcysteine oxidase/farnesylcysteine lyase
MHYLLLLLAPLAFALQQFPFGLPKVAIVGAGPAGTFATFALSHFLPSENAALQSEVHLFERSSYIGGRSTTVQLPVPENSYAELGASIFVDANKNLMKAARVFNLTLQDGHGEDERLDKNPMAVYDGERFVFEASSSKYWDLARLLVRYGRSPLTARKLVRTAVASFLSLYSPGTASKGPFSMQQYADVLGFTPLLEETAFTYYTRNGVSATFVNVCRRRRFLQY